MQSWTLKRKISLAVHALLVLIPVVAAIIAGVNLWTWVLGSAWLAVPVIASLEGVAFIGFLFHLYKVESPLVKARHIIPWYSLATLAYELGVFLVGRLGLYAGLGFTAFLVAVFGTLFILLFGTIERLFITEIEAAKEKAQAEMHAILVRVEKFTAESQVFNEANAKLRLAEQARFGAMQTQQFAPTYSSQLLLEENGDLHALVEQRTGELERAQDEINRLKALATAKPEPRKDLLDSLLENGAEPVKRATVTEFVPAPTPSWTLASFLEDAGLTANRARAMVTSYTNGTAHDAYGKLSKFGYLPDGLVYADFLELFEELMAGDELVTEVHNADGDERQVFKSHLDGDTLPDELQPKVVALTFEGDGTEFTLQGLELPAGVSPYEADPEPKSFGAETVVGTVIETLHQGLGGEPLAQGWDTVAIAEHNRTVAAPAADACEFCGNGVTNADKSVSRRGSWRWKLEGKVGCKACREERR